MLYLIRIIRDDKSKIGKTLTWINIVIALIICVATTVPIDFHAGIAPVSLDGSPFTFPSLIGYVLVWWLFSALGGALISIIPLNISMIYGFIKERTLISNKGYIPPGLETGVATSFLVGGFLTAYTMVLYALGLKDSFFPLFLLS